MMIHLTLHLTRLHLKDTVQMQSVIEEIFLWTAGGKLQAMQSTFDAFFNKKAENFLQNVPPLGPS
jgi:hypothetical protein